MTRTDDPGDFDGDEAQLDAELLQAWRAEEPPADFAARVAAVYTAEASQRPRKPAHADPLADAAVSSGAWRTPRRAQRGRIGLLSVAVLGAAVLVVLLNQAGHRSAGGSGSGGMVAGARETIAIGERAVAVAEPGAALDWRYGERLVQVEQQRGNVFYRVERGTGFVVNTPAGRVEVHGTSFRVEVTEMMKKGMPAVAGAVIGALVVVTVYEGRVLFANARGELALAPGEAAAASEQDAPERRNAALSPGGSAATPGSDAPAEAAPPADASRDQLLARDEMQRGELARLRRRVRELEQGGGGGPGGRRRGDGPRVDKDGHYWFDPSAETLKSFVPECRVRFDTPNTMDSQPPTIGSELAGEVNISDTERAAINESLAELHEKARAEIRALYLEATGDTRGADLLSPGAMRNEIADKALPGEDGRARRKIAKERAGMAQPPGDLAGTSPLERYYRILAAMGDDAERRVGGVVGRERARALREKNDGWGSAMEMAGCDDEP